MSYLRKISNSFKKYDMYIMMFIIILLLCYIYIHHEPSKNEENGSSVSSSTNQQASHSRLLCYVLTTDLNSKRSWAIKETWGKRCDTLIFISDKNDTTLGAIHLSKATEGYHYLWGKSREALKYFYDEYLEDYDWFFKADTDSYVIVENLQYVFTLYDPNIPIALGERFHHKKYETEYLSGGSGYALSRTGLKLFVEKAYPNPNICPDDPKEHSEDVLLGKCLTNIGVMLGDTRDEKGKNRFFQHKPQGYISGRFNDWYPRFQQFEYGEGKSVFSDTTVSFHQLKDAGDLYAMEFLLYDLKIYGLERKFDKPAIAGLPPDVESIPKSVLQKFSNSST